jgi:diketogulonate reductase-like aldo/keto reductase
MNFLQSSDIPLFGLGTWKIGKDVVEDIVYHSIKTLGITHFDCACDYGNEVEVGRGIKRAIDEGIIKREDLWITSKLWNTFHLEEHVELACRKSLSDLQIDYFDLYLIHFPIAMKYVPIEKRYPPEWIFDPENPNPRIELEPRAPMHLTWRGMEKLVERGLTRRIGVCNFNVQLIMDLLSYANIPPYVNQIELHPYNSQQDFVTFLQSKGIRVVGFSPLGSPSYIELNMDNSEGVGLLNNEDILAIASAHGKTPAQVLLRWNIQRGVAVIPKSSKLARLKENADIFDFELTSEQVTGMSYCVLLQNHDFPYIIQAPFEDFLSYICSSRFFFVSFDN